MPFESENDMFESALQAAETRTEVAATAELLGDESPPKPKPSKAGLDDSLSSKGQQGKAKRGRKKGQIQCRGCRKLFDADALSTSSDFCLSCKRSLDRLSRVASREGDKAVQFLARTRADPKLVPELLKRYHEVAGVPVLGKKSQKPFSVMKYIEAVESVSGCERRNRHKMMWQKEYVDWAQTVEGGKKSEEAACADWALWCLPLSGLANFPNAPLNACFQGFLTRGSNVVEEC